ncbi:PspA/IM30 family protein [Lichenifustis flavocetrariae]|uniref:PspA/IM30 family protein n=1 Tax=Lichenifustis flavocetrariae TaxID=2949735 RepID=A0AA41Z541_9HYPH|nr:PspA/IM30 family protein [Lichenifustis flavocetrariae]MCW6512960.1 PspA/IM30 family protein [Lichenifustis flavocetrariae]
MSIFGRIADLFQAKTHKLLSSLEDPNETLDLSYEKMITGLQDTKRHLADVVAQQQSLHRQIGKADAEIAEAESDARTAVTADRDDLARAALVHKQDALAKRRTLDEALAAITPQVQKLVEYERRLADRIEQFRTQKEVMKTTYTAAQAQVKVTEALTGLGGHLGHTGDALRRVNEKVEGMRDKADAMGHMLEAGVLTDQFDDRSASKRELDVLKATSAVDDELAQLKASTTKVIPPL